MTPTEPESSFVSRYEAFADRCAMWGVRVAALALVLICGLVMAEIISRNFLGRSTMVADEMCGYLNVAVVFLGLGYTMKEGGFIRVELLYVNFKGLLRRFADWMNVILSTFYFIFVFYYMIKYTYYSYSNDILSAELTQTPLYIPQIFVVIGSLILLIYLFKFILTRCRNVP